MTNLSSQTVCTSPGSPTGYAVPSGNIMFPTPMVTLAKPVSYEFRVAEYVDEKETVMKVRLQVQVWEHDNYGSGILKQPWTDVERVRLPYVATMG